MATRWPSILVFVAAAAGFAFASFSTADFAEHLDRQVHGIHCSFIPGIEGEDASGNTDCHVTLMSPYSSVLRDKWWGGIPVSLPAMGVFAFLGLYALFLVFTDRGRDPRATLFLVLGSVIPLGASIAMGYIALSKLDAACKLCIGIYAASGLTFLFAIVQWAMARRSVPTETDIPTSYGALAGAFAIGLLSVFAPATAYAMMAPNYESTVRSCMELGEPAPEELLISLGGRVGGTRTLEVLDPLCPSCKGFETRMAASSFEERIERFGILFPLDSACNWMLSESIHPGACTVSEAVLCADDDAQEVLAWAFEHQEEIKERSRADEDAPARMVVDRFPELAECVGSPQVRSKLNRSLRWAVANELPVLTPQFFVGNRKLCDEDTDLGMDYALTRLLGDAR